MSHSRTLRLAAIISAATLGLSGCSQLGVSDWFGPSRTADTGDYATASIPGAAERPVVETGVAAWDGDISSPGMTAAHATMAPGSWARVTNATTGASAVVRITRRMQADRGRAIELSRDAAAAVGALHDGLATVLIEPIDPRQAAPNERLWVRADQPAAPAVEAVRPDPAYQTASYQPARQAASAGGGVDYSEIETASIPGRVGPRQTGFISQPATNARPMASAGARYLQVGSFRNAQNAHRMLERLNSEGMTNGTYGDGFVETAYVGGSVYHRVRVGPLETETEAQRALRDAKALGHKEARVLRP